jgi:replicative superfamily II helicase
MVDFDKLRQQRTRSAAIDPLEIFRRLPKPAGIDDLWSSQAEALKQWFDRRNEKDLIIKLNTGGGKTLVGLLIAQSILAEQKGAVLYLCANSQLQGQTLAKSHLYGIPAVPYSKGDELPGDFLGAKSIMIATYHALFNGLSRFRLAGSAEDSVKLQGIILDDAHTAFSAMREIFTLSVTKSSQEQLYKEITTLFRLDFGVQGRQGTFDDIVEGHDDSVLEVPYWGWKNRSNEVRHLLSGLSQTDFRFVWPLLRDHFDLCHVLITRNEVSITSMYPIVDMFPSFVSCPRRIYMSATVADDSSIIRTFDAKLESVSKPIVPTSLAGVGERMMLVPDLMHFGTKDTDGIVKRLATRVSKDHGVVILTPSTHRAEKWTDVAKIATGKEVDLAVANLVNGSSHGPFVFPSRFDGIDLQGNSCRLLILAGLPRGDNPYDLFRATILEGSGLINMTLAQRIEQGMGRGTRGGSDYCVVVLVGKDLVGWVSQAANLKLLTAPTQVQLAIGIDVSKEISTEKDLNDAANKCLNRSLDWTKYHADALVDATTTPLIDMISLRVAASERLFFTLAKNGDYEKATAVVEKIVQEEKSLDPKIKGWLLALAARSAHFWGNTEKSLELQRVAFGSNKNVHRPSQGTEYFPLAAPTRQMEKIADYIDGFALRKGALIHFEELVAHLVPTATSNQFEEALKDLGVILGFSAERPEKEYKVGPDVLWLLEKQKAWVIEAKSQKDPKNALNKEEHGQLLQAVEWFQREYPGVSAVRAIVHPNSIATKSVTVGDTKSLTLSELNKMISAMRTLLTELTDLPLTRQSVLTHCTKRLSELHLTPDSLNTFLVGFENVS